jgi:putative protein-disulfide isomerase
LLIRCDKESTIPWFFFDRQSNMLQLDIANAETAVPIVSLQYIFDPLCGWCYGSAPALEGLASTFPDTLELVPSGLFSDFGARDLSPALAAHAWTNDQRIASMTGQPFTTAYHRQILLNSNLLFDSGMMNRAMTAIQAIERTLEPKLLHRFQIARYVEAQDTSSPSVVGRISAEFVNASGHHLDADDFTERLRGDTTLTLQTEVRTRAGQSLMSRLGVRGVPVLLAQVDGLVKSIGGGALYGGPQVLLTALKELVDSN